MSIDLEVYGTDRPSLHEVLSRIAGPSLVVEKAANGMTIARRKRGSEPRLICTVDGPFTFDEREDDVPDCVFSAVLAVRWMIQISSPATLAEADAAVVARLGRLLADAACGVAYDPQADALVWPRSVKRLRTVQRNEGASEGRLCMEFLLSRHLTRGISENILTVIRRRLPEALPRRFGTFEPLQGRLETDGTDAFTALFDDRHMIFWKGISPFDLGYAHPARGWGSALSEDERQARTPTLGGRPARRPDGIQLSFKAEAASDPRWLDALVGLFRSLGDALDPFYAAAYVRAEEIVHAERLAAGYWLGVPPWTAWLTWIGKPYVGLLPGSAPGLLERKSDHAFLRAADSPLHREVIERSAIDWSPEYIRTGSPRDEALAATVIPPID